MGHKRVECYIVCKHCDVRVGTVTAVTKGKNDYVWHNTPDPNPMPLKCKLCAGVLERVEP